MPEKPHPPQSEFESTVFAAEIGDAVQIDLHGLSAADAECELDAFIHHEFMKGTEVVKIVHGRGVEKLRKMTQKYLASSPIVEYFRGSQNPAQQNAVTYAVLSRKG